MKCCSYCGGRNDDDSQFCSVCGKQFPQGNKCPYCGASINDGDAFCQNCGRNLADGSYANSSVLSDEIQAEGDSSFKKYLPYVLGIIALIALIGGGWYGYNTYSEYSAAKQAREKIVADSVVVADEDTEKTSEQEEKKLITEWYDYVFGKIEISDDVINKFLSSKIKESIWTEDYDGCYEIWKFRTIACDYDPIIGDVSKIEDISVNSEGWYEVKYLDMGYNGKTTIKMEKLKIVDFVPDSSWNDFESSVESSYNTSDDSYSSSNASTSSRTFANEQMVVGYLANQTFRSSDGFTIRFDGSGRMFSEGDFAGVISVLRFNSTSALLRYGGGQYTEGKFRVDIVGDKFQLTDPVDGTVYYQL